MVREADLADEEDGTGAWLVRCGSVKARGVIQ
jgi:hypothetical protein